MYAESYDSNAYLTGLGSFFCHRHFGSFFVAYRERELVATRSSSELPQDRVHGASSAFGFGMSKVDSRAHYQAVSSSIHAIHLAVGDWNLQGILARPKRLVDSGFGRCACSDLACGFVKGDGLERPFAIIVNCL
jgi:hypothetical protein